jgi:hypothetical protein
MLLLLLSACIPLAKGASLVPYSSISIPISDLFNNQAASINGSFGDFDGLGGSYDGSLLPSGVWTYDGITASSARDCYKSRGTL